jgi:hypothetical protein
LDDAVLALAALRVPVVVAGGNMGLEACLLSPTAAAIKSQFVISVGGTQNANGKVGDPLLWFDSGNYGRCIDILAPSSLDYDNNLGLVSGLPACMFFLEV